MYVHGEFDKKATASATATRRVMVAVADFVAVACSRLSLLQRKVWGAFFSCLFSSFKMSQVLNLQPVSIDKLFVFCG